VREARDWKAGQAVELKPQTFAAYRDDAVVHRG
jgi:hypothetical protein